jgi:Pyruvate/2-oxoacid:ferredoxin oxidoreductase delta subunit
MPCPRIILSKHEHPDARMAALERDIVERCQSESRDCLVVPPLYHLAEASKLWKALADRVEEAVLFGWLHPRPICWLLWRHQVCLAESQVLDLRTFVDADAALAAARGLSRSSNPVDASGATAGLSRSAGSTLGQAGHCAEQGSSDRDFKSGGALERLRAPTRLRWYPVIDAARCINCQHCLQFCLFGVYELDAGGKVQVRRPDQCKPGCPACARICPQSAIMFPLYDKDAAIAGAPGKLVALDAAARRMFYVRTSQPCSACGRKVDAKAAAVVAGGSACPECGCPLLRAAEPSKGPGEAAAQPAFSDLDDLVDQLDRAMQRRG